MYIYISGPHTPWTLNTHVCKVGNRFAQTVSELLTQVCKKCISYWSCLYLFIYFLLFFCPPTDATEVLLCLLLLAIIFFLQTPKQQDLLCLCPPIQSGCEKDFGKNCWGEKQLLPPPKRFVSMSLTAFSLYCTNVFPSANVLARDRTTRSVISGALKQPGT